MNTRLRSLCAVAVFALVLAPPSLAAQGVSSAAITGQVTDEGGTAVGDVVLTLVHTGTGTRYSARTALDGRYVFENVQVGGPYTLQARALGFAPADVGGLMLQLGQRYVQNVSMRRTAVEVEGITVAAEIDPLINQARTGAQAFVSESLLARLPTLGRNFTDFIVTVPQVVTQSVPGATVGGQNNRFNNIQIDGGVNNDLFGLAASGTPGGQADAHPISVEAVKEYQVLIAPFDVRQGGFVGGLINAVTKSGSNEYHGSVFGYLQNDGLVGKSLAGNPADEFHQTQFGATLGGPILRDRAHFFIATDIQDRAAPFVGEQIGTNGVSQAVAQRVRDILRTDPVYDFDPGPVDAPTQENPDRNFFGKVSLQLGTNSLLELSHNHVNAADDNLIRNAAATGNRDGFQLGASGYQFASVTNTTKLKWTAQLFERVNNELIVGYQTVRDHRDLPNRVPLLFVQDQAGRNVAAGADRFSHENFLDQDIIEVTDNVTFPMGSHVVTVGTHNEFFGFVNGFFPASLGIWNFADTTALISHTPNRYEIALSLVPGGPTADWRVKQFGLYVQDRWSPRAGLTLTLGLRMDLPTMDAPRQNPSRALIDTIGVNTGNFPKANALWSPRLGFNYDLSGDASTVLRGGVGVFSGRPPYVWLSNAYSNTGLEQVTLICDGGAGQTDTVPTFTNDPDNQPAFCGQQLDPADARAATPSIVFFDPSFRFPQSFKVALGLDRRLPWGMVGTFDFLYTKSINQFYITDANLQGLIGFSDGEAGRPLYGALSATSGSTTPVRKNGGFRDVLGHRNESADRSFQISAQLQKRFSNNLEFNAGYTYSHTEDLFSLTSSIAFSNYRFTALDGTLENRNLRTSVFDIPHKISVAGIVGLPYGVNLSLIYVAQAGHPFTYMVQDDANADGVTANDVVYVPRSRSDIALSGSVATQDSTWTLLNGYIDQTECLSKSRGLLLQRNICYNDWLSELNLRLTKTLPIITGHRLELSLDMFNFLHLLNKDWGVFRQVSGFEQINLLRRTGYDAVNRRGIYTLPRNSAGQLQLPVPVESARWRIQLGAKYLF